ncbi:MAG: hypothetical protein RUMPE_00420 [Eubacteriales bacterium SKADARSKE-1]|nr:hypothetical protein [Eubacteriales bacterium SKADARSKE-1]
MIRNMSLSKTVVLNVLIILFWNIYIFFLCRQMKSSFFNPQKKPYKARNFECGGKFYNEKLKIKKWKEVLPQYISKNGFSKRRFSEKNLIYINRFILETCRAEWNHKMCMIIAFPITIFNEFKIGIIFTLLILLTNLPFIFIQRYNRFRLLSLKRHRVKKSFFAQEQNDNSKIEVPSYYV